MGDSALVNDQLTSLGRFKLFSLSAGSMFFVHKSFKMCSCGFHEQVRVLFRQIELNEFSHN